MANAGNPAMTMLPQTNGSGDIFAHAKRAMQNGLAGTDRALAGPNIGAFFNPFQSQVIDTTMAGLDRGRQMTQLGVDDAATAAKAFGGSRHGVLGAETNKNFFDTAATTLAGLNKSGFDTALAAGQNQQGVDLQGGNQLATLGQMLFGTGNSLNQSLSAQGGQNQNMVQDLINAIKGQFEGFTGAPMASLSAPLAAVGAANMGQNTQKTTKKPGLLNIIGSVLSAIPGAG
jgi:hypothetical protein